MAVSTIRVYRWIRGAQQPCQLGRCRRFYGTSLHTTRRIIPHDRAVSDVNETNKIITGRD